MTDETMMYASGIFIGLAIVFGALAASGVALLAIATVAA